MLCLKLIKLAFAMYDFVKKEPWFFIFLVFSSLHFILKKHIKEKLRIARAKKIISPFFLKKNA